VTDEAPYITTLPPITTTLFGNAPIYQWYDVSTTTQVGVHNADFDGDSTAVTTVTTTGAEYESGYYWAPYTPINYTIDSQGYANFTRPTDHFIDHEDLFKI